MAGANMTDESVCRGLHLATRELRDRSLHIQGDPRQRPVTWKEQTGCREILFLVIPTWMVTMISVPQDGHYGFHMSTLGYDVHGMASSRLKDRKIADHQVNKEIWAVATLEDRQTIYT